MWFLMGNEIGFAVRFNLYQLVLYVVLTCDFFFSRSDSRGAATPLGYKKKESAAITRNTGRL